MHLFFEVVVFIKYMTGGIFVKAQLILENGKIFTGEMFGKAKKWNKYLNDNQWVIRNDI